MSKKPLKMIRVNPSEYVKIEGLENPYEEYRQELKKRIMEIRAILEQCKDKDFNGMIILYFLLVHHELFVKYKLNRDCVIEIYNSKRIEYNHDIEALLELADIDRGYLYTIIKEQCAKIKDKFKIRISCYPNLRYNNCSILDIKNLAIKNERPSLFIQYDVQKDGDFTTRILKEFLQVFSHA